MESSFSFRVGLISGAAMTAFAWALVDGIDSMNDVTIKDILDKGPIPEFIHAGTLTQEQVSAAAQKGIDGLAAVANQQFPNKVDGRDVSPEEIRAATRQAVEAYLAGDKSKPPVIAVPATAAPAVPAP